MIDEEKLREVFGERRRWIVALLVAVSVVAGYFLSGLSMEPDFGSLLPETASSVEAIDRFDREFETDLTPAAVLVEGPDAEANRAAVEEVAGFLEDRAGVSFVWYRRPVEYFEQRRLLYADHSALETFVNRVESRVDWEKKRANPLYASLDEEPPEIDAESLFEEQRRELPEHAHFRNDAGDRFVVFAEFAFRTLEYRKTTELREALLEAFESWRSERGADVELSFSGRHFKQLQQKDAHRRHLLRASGLAALAVFLFLVVYFRRWRAPFVVGAPLALGTMWGFGWAGLSVGRLTPLTISFGAVLIGLGIDYGIHLYVRYREESRRSGHWGALERTFEKAGPPCFYAALTTALAFGTLTTSSLPAFAEFGLVALGGILCILAAYVGLLPLLVRPTETGSSTDGPGGGDYRGPSDGVRERVADLSTGATARRGAAFGLVFLAAVGAWGVGSIGFDDSFRAVLAADLPVFEAEEKMRETVGIRQQPAFVPVESLGHARRVTDELERRRREAPHGELIGSFASVADFIPARQDAKLELLERLREILGEIPDSAVDDVESLIELREEVARLLEGGRIAPGDLPKVLRRQFSVKRGEESGERVRSLVAVYPARTIYRSSAATRFVDLLSGLPDPEGEPTVDGIAFERLLAEIVAYIERDAVQLLSLLVVGLLALAFVAARDTWEWLATSATLGLALLVGAGLCGLASVDFNFLNVVVWPIWIGVGLDALFHLNRHPPPAEREAADQLDDYVATVGAVAAAFATTMLGFGALALSRQPGLGSFGRAAVLGFAAILVVSLLARVTRPRDADDRGAEP